MDTLEIRSRKRKIGDIKANVANLIILNRSQNNPGSSSSSHPLISRILTNVTNRNHLTSTYLHRALQKKCTFLSFREFTELRATLFFFFFCSCSVWPLYSNPLAFLLLKTHPTCSHFRTFVLAVPLHRVLVSLISHAWNQVSILILALPKTLCNQPYR